MKVIILGHKGMLGHMVKHYLEDKFEIETVEYRWPTEEFKNKINSSNAEYLINCIGAIPQRTKKFDINFELPIWLDSNFNGRIVNPGTDCEMDDDSYGISKKRARDYIVEKGSRTKVIKASIIGPELNSTSSLLEWFLNSNQQVGGYTKAMWNGVTTLEWAKQCNSLLNNWDQYKNETILESTCLSKFDLLSLFKDVFNKDIQIVPNSNVEVDKCLTGDIKTISIENQLQELKKYYYDSRS
jgi:dTDP-4-dehydrorhamnose reductase